MIIRAAKSKVPINAVPGHVKWARFSMSGNATNQELASVNRLKFEYRSVC
jgi:hypothetical protein